MSRAWTSFLRLGARGYTERVLFIAAVVACFFWYFQEKETFRFWHDRSATWNAELWGIDTRFSTEYGPKDATGDWVAFAINQNLLSGFSDPKLKGHEFTRGTLGDHELKALISPLPATLPAANTPLILKYCISPATHQAEQIHPGWLSFKSQDGFVNLLFSFRNPLIMARMPRLVVVAQPAAIFNGTPVRLFWRGPDRKQFVTERLRSMSGYFRVQGDVAVAELPLGRLVEWSKSPIAGLIRVDLTPKGNEGRIRMIALGAGR